MAPVTRRSCPSGRVRFRTHRAAERQVGCQLVEPADPREVIVPVAADDRACGMCAGWHVRAAWSPWARRGSRAARERRHEDVQPWPVTVPAPAPPAGRASPRAARPDGSSPGGTVPPAVPARGGQPASASPLEEARRALGG